jgi:uncharacterized protein (TIGR02599 family)
VEQFQGARRGFESMTRRLSQATLNTYWDYEYKTEGSGKNRKLIVGEPPLGYARQSEMRFRSGAMETLAPKEGVLRPTHGVFFQAPLGLTEDNEEGVLDDGAEKLKTYRLNPLGDLLNSWGYFVEAGTDQEFIPPFLTKVIKARKRYRLWQFMEPTERALLDDPSAIPVSDSDGRELLVKNENWDRPWNGWFVEPMKRARPESPLRVLSENIVALVVLPRLSQQDEEDRRAKKLSMLCPVYDYDSKRNSNSEAAVADALNPNVKGSSGDRPEAVNPKNQLPPVVTVAMVAIDELSAERLSDSAAADDLAQGIKWEGLFEKSERMEDDPATPDSGDGDLRMLEQQLIARHLNYRVYTSNVTIRGAKWSRSQK